MKNRSAFTLFEVLATLLLLAVGITSVIGMMRYGTRVSMDAQMRTTALLVAETVTVDARPNNLTADASDADDDGWMLASGTMATPALGAYSFTVQGHLNGFYVRRLETSSVNDILDPSQRWAHITVDVYAGDADRYLTTVRQSCLRQTRAP